MATETDITGQLADYFDWLERELGNEGLAVQRPAGRARVLHRAPALVAAGLLVVGAVVGAIALVREPTKSVRPAAGVSAWSEIAAAAWTLDSPPAGMRLQYADASYQLADTLANAGFVVRLYATSSATPEADPYVRLTAYPTGTYVGSIPVDATTVELGNGVNAMQWTRGDHRFVSFARDGVAFRLDIVGIDDPVGLAATATPAPDGYGAVIDTALLPAGVAERGAGTIFEVRFISRQAMTDAPIGQAHWDGAGKGVFYLSFVESPEVFRLHRIEYDYASLGEVDVNGHTALRTTSTDGPTSSVEHTEVYWNDNGRTIMVGGYGGVTAEQVIATARALRPATEAEWSAMADTQQQAPVTAPPPTTDPTATVVEPQPLGFAEAPTGYTLVGQGIVPAGRESVSAIVLVKRAADGTVTDSAIVRYDATRESLGLPGYEAPIVRWSTNPVVGGALSIEAYAADQADADALAPQLASIALALRVDAVAGVDLDGTALPDGWEMATQGFEPQQQVPDQYQAFELPDGGRKLRVDNRFVDFVDDYQYWVMGRTLAPVTVRGHGGFVSTIPYDPLGWATVLIWEEAPGQWVTLMAQGWTTEQALALADQLVPTS